MRINPHLDPSTRRDTRVVKLAECVRLWQSHGPPLKPVSISAPRPTTVHIHAHGGHHVMGAVQLKQHLWMRGRALHVACDRELYPLWHSPQMQGMYNSENGKRHQ